MVTNVNILFLRNMELVVLLNRCGILISGVRLVRLLLLHSQSACRRRFCIRAPSRAFQSIRYVRHPPLLKSDFKPVYMQKNVSCVWSRGTQCGRPAQHVSQICLWEPTAADFEIATRFLFGLLCLYMSLSLYVCTKFAPHKVQSWSPGDATRSQITLGTFVAL